MCVHFMSVCACVCMCVRGEGSRYVEFTLYVAIKEFNVYKGLQVGSRVESFSDKVKLRHN